METQTKEVAVKEPTLKEQTIIPLHQAHVYLGLKFLKDYKEMIIHFSLEQQIEITEHLMGLIELMEKNLKEQDEVNYYEYLKRESVLLKKYGKTLKPFIEKSFCQYFYFEHALVAIGIYTQQQYDEFIPEQKFFSIDEVFDYHQICLAGLTYNRNMLYLQKEPESSSDQKPSINYNIEWTAQKGNKNEFVQLVYALHQAEYINNGKGEIMKIVRAMAEALNFKLSDNWHSNHYNSISRQNSDYEPKIFKTLQESYEKYSKKSLDEKTNRKQ
jgi:hypothetical protein